MDAALTRLVWQRAKGCCEYCQTPQAADEIAFQIDHVMARKHGGPTTVDNLCLSCFHCNSSKGSDIATLAPRTRRLVPLFNPRRQEWPRHFRWEGAYQVGRTQIGDATIVLLKINDPFRVDLRETLIEEGVFPPV
ncbi:HNH endonuclease [Paludisphaera borealis]|uniref:HNH nuclease domain-containing protein n=1 Tax=Paludisphaera borealis TaxID=1387353 RepID=A0A1U7CRK6_9BACT|nr:HNH endonuclease signature motif containing protein [Paludisphaera borealis]APW61580.1 hypothetical protein BSF38_03098 [Paludisphaera borealis]